MALTQSNIELLRIADAVAKEIDISRDEALTAMELGIKTASYLQYSKEYELRVEIDRKTGEVHLGYERIVVEEVENPLQEISLEEASMRIAGVQLGDIICDPLRAINLVRIGAQLAKQAITQHVYKVRREKEFEEYKDKKGKILHGVVKRLEFGHVIISLNQTTEAIIYQNSLIPLEHSRVREPVRETFRVNDRIRAYVQEVSSMNKGPQIILSRTHPQFIAQLFAQEVPEVYDNIIEIKNVARDPGSRAKMAVFCADTSIDPVGACVGVRGARVQAVINELQGEKIDIIQWSPDIPTFAVNALAPAQVSKVVIDEESHRMDVVVPENQLSLAIGSRGQNVRLASNLTGWKIDILTEEVELKRRNEEFHITSQLFMDRLNVEDVVAHLLATEGFTSVEEVAYVPVEDLSAIEGFDDAIAEALKERATDYLKEQASLEEKILSDAGISKDLHALPEMTHDILLCFGKNEVRNLEDLAELSLLDMQDILGEKQLEEAIMQEWIMIARKSWFPEENNEK